MLTEADIRQALRDCYDAEIPLNILDLGIVDSIEIALDPDAPGSNIPGVPPRHRVTLTLSPASDDEAKTAQLTAQIQNRLAGIETISRASIELNHDAWAPARITPEGRRILNLDNPFSILNNRVRS